MPNRKQPQKAATSRNDPQDLHRHLADHISGNHDVTLGWIAGQLKISDNTLKARNRKPTPAHVRDLIRVVKSRYGAHLDPEREQALWRAAGLSPSDDAPGAAQGSPQGRADLPAAAGSVGHSLRAATLLAAVEIGTLATRLAGGMDGRQGTTGAIREAIGRRLVDHWRACRAEGREPLGGGLPAQLRHGWLRSVAVAAISFGHRQIGSPLGEAAAWARSLQKAADAEWAELAAADGSAVDGVQGLAFDVLPAADRMGDADLRAALTQEFFQEVEAAAGEASAGETVFSSRLRQALAASRVGTAGMPGLLSSQFSSGWIAGQGRRVHWAEVFVACFAQQLSSRPQARAAFENQVLRPSFLREQSIPHDAYVAALSQLSALAASPNELLPGPPVRMPPADAGLPEPPWAFSAPDTTRPGGLAGGIRLDEISAIADRLAKGGVIADEGMPSLDPEAGDDTLGALHATAAASRAETGRLVLAADEAAVLQGYLEWIVREFRHLPNPLQIGLESIPLPLDRVFVTVRGYPGTVTEIRGHRSSSRRAGPASLRDRDQPRYFAAPAEPPKDLSRALRDSRTMVVLGDPGSGKTTLTRWIALNFARAMLDPQAREVVVPVASVDSNAPGDDERVSLGPVQLPIFLRISDLAAAVKEADKPLVELLHRGRFRSAATYPEGHARFGKSIEPEALGRLMVRHVQAQRAVLLLDGLDEVATPEDRLDVVNRIHAFVDVFLGGERDGTRLVVTSRLVGYESNPLRNSIARYTIESMDAAAIRQYCRGWHAAWAESSEGLTPEQRVHGSERAAQGLLTQIFADDSSSLPELASNPFMLGLLCALNLEGQECLPTSRTGLYGSLVRRELSGSWIRGRPGREKLRDLVTLLLGGVAQWMHRTDASGVVQSDALDRMTRRLLHQDPAFAPLVPYEDELVTGAGLLIERGFRQYAFRHLTIQEYLTAIALVSDPAGAAARLWACRGDSRWREVALFSFGLLASGAGPDGIAPVCTELLAQEDAHEGTFPGVTLLISSAMAQIPDFPVEVLVRVLERLFARYAQVSVSARQAAFCETVEVVFGQEMNRRDEPARRNAARALLHAHAVSDDPARAQAVAAIVARQPGVEASLLVKLVKAARVDRSRGRWRIRWALVDLLSRAEKALRDADCAAPVDLGAIDPETLATLRDPARVRGSRLFERPPSSFEPVELPVDLFPLRRRLLADEAALGFVNGSPGWTRLVIALHGGLPRLGLKATEEALLRMRGRARLPLAWSAMGAAAQADCVLEPRLDMVRSTPLELVPQLFWRDTPLSAWLVEQLDDRVPGHGLVDRLIELWHLPDLLDMARASCGAESAWMRLDETQVRRAHRNLLADILLALAALGREPESLPMAGAIEPALLESVGTELEWLEAYLDEPASRGALVIENSLSQDWKIAPHAFEPERAPASTAQALELAFRDALPPDLEGGADPAAGLLRRALGQESLPAEVAAELGQLSAGQFLAAVARLAEQPAVPWWPESPALWIHPCLAAEEPSTLALKLLSGIARLPIVGVWEHVRSSCLAAAAAVLESDRGPLLPLAIRIAAVWAPTSEPCKAALGPWLGSDTPDSDDGWKGLQTRRFAVDPATDPVLAFWILRQTEPADATARRSWVGALYATAARIAAPVARLGAELHVFTACDADETLPQWQRMQHMASDLADASQRELWIDRIARLRELVVERNLLGFVESHRTIPPTHLVAMLGQRPIKAYHALSTFDEERPRALAMFWAYVLANDGDDPVYNCAVILDTIGKTLGARPEDLMLSLVALDADGFLSRVQGFPVLLIPDSPQRRRELLLTALTVLLRFPRSYDMLVEWLLRRLMPYLRRLDQEFVPLAIAVACRLREPSRSALLNLLCPQAGGDAEAALAAAWQALPAIPDAYLRWRSEWLLAKLSRRRRPVQAMLADIAALADAEECAACTEVMQMDGHADVANGAPHRALLEAPPPQSGRALREPARAGVRSARGAGLLQPAGGAQTWGEVAFESLEKWLQTWAADRPSPTAGAIAGIMPLRLGAMRRSRSDGADKEVMGLLKSFIERGPADESSIRPDPVTGLRFHLLTTEVVAALRPAALAAPAGSGFPLLLQLLRGADAKAEAFLHEVVGGRDDAWGAWAALMLAEQGVWTRQIAARVRSLLGCTEAVIRTRAFLALARGGEARDLGDAPNEISAARLGADVVEELASTLARPDQFHPVVDMTMRFALDRVVFDDSVQMEAWLQAGTGAGRAQRVAWAVLRNVCRATLPVCWILANHLASAATGNREVLILSCISLWVRDNWRSDLALWQKFREALFEIGDSDDAAHAVAALEALGYVGTEGWGDRLLRLAQRHPLRRSAVLRCLGIGAASGIGEGEAERAFIVESLQSQDTACRLAAAEALLRSRSPILVLEPFLPQDAIVEALVAHLDGYFVGVEFVRKVQGAADWLAEVTHAECVGGTAVTQTTFARLLSRIGVTIPRQSFVSTRQEPVYARLDGMLAIAAAAAELMPETCRGLLDLPEFSLDADLATVVRRHESYVARQAALVLLSLRRRFSCEFARALEAAMFDLSMIQSSAVECVARMEAVDEDGLEELARLVGSDDTLVAFAAAQVVQRIGTGRALDAGIRARFELAAAQALQRALEVDEPPRAAFAVESNLSDWSNRTVLRGLLKDAREDALFTLRFPEAQKTAKKQGSDFERVEIEIVGTRHREPLLRTLTFGAMAVKAKHPAMHQADAVSAEGGVIPTELMNALEKVREAQLKSEARPSFARMLHAAVQSRAAGTEGNAS